MLLAITYTLKTKRIKVAKLGTPKKKEFWDKQKSFCSSDRKRTNKPANKIEREREKERKWRREILREGERMRERRGGREKERAIVRTIEWNNKNKNRSKTLIKVRFIKRGHTSIY